MQEKSGEFLSWRDLSADEVYHVAYKENEVRDLNNDRITIMRKIAVEDREILSQEWFIDQAIARGKKPEIPELKDMPRAWLSSMLKANTTISRKMLSEASGVSLGAISKYINAMQKITDQARARLENGFDKLNKT